MDLAFLGPTRTTSTTATTLDVFMSPKFAWDAYQLYLVRRQRLIA